MQTIVDWSFTLLDIVCMTACSVYLVFLLPRSEINGKEKNASHRESCGVGGVRADDCDDSDGLA